MKGGSSFVRSVLLVVGVGVVIGCLMSCASAPTLKGMDTASEASKAQLAKQMFGYTHAHKLWAEIEQGKGKSIANFAKPKHDPAALQNVKKVAVVGFNFVVLKKLKSGEMYKFKNIETYVDQMYDALIEQLQRQGYEVVPVAQVKENELYQNLKYKEEGTKAKEKWGDYYEITTQAHELKKIEATKVTAKPFNPLIKKQIEGVTQKMTEIQQLAQSLGVDAVLMARVTMTHDLGMMGSSAKFIGVERGSPPLTTLDVFSAAEPRIIGSVGLKGAVGIPIKSKLKLLAVSDFSEYGADVVKTYRELAELMVLKLKSDTKN